MGLNLQYSCVFSWSRYVTWWISGTADLVPDDKDLLTLDCTNAVCSLHFVLMSIWRIYMKLILCLGHYNDFIWNYSLDHCFLLSLWWIHLKSLSPSFYIYVTVVNTFWNHSLHQFGLMSLWWIHLKWPTLSDIRESKLRKGICIRHGYCMLNIRTL